MAEQETIIALYCYEVGCRSRAKLVSSAKAPLQNDGYQASVETDDDMVYRRIEFCLTDLLVGLKPPVDHPSINDTGGTKVRFSATNIQPWICIERKIL